MPPLSLSVLKTGLIKKGLTRSLDVRRKFCAQKVVRHRHGGAGWGRWEVPCPWQGVGAGVGVVLGPQPDPFCGSHTPQVGLATYSYRSLPWLLLNHSSDLPAVLEQIRTMRYEEPSGNAIGEGNGLGLTRETHGTFLTPPPPFFLLFFFPPGAAITFARTYLLSPGAGRRPGVPAVLVVLADGPSGDDALAAARDIKAAGEGDGVPSGRGPHGTRTLRVLRLGC